MKDKESRAVVEALVQHYTDAKLDDHHLITDQKFHFPAPTALRIQIVSVTVRPADCGKIFMETQRRLIF